MRTETFVFEFSDTEVFKEFFNKYFPTTKEAEIPGMKCICAAAGDLSKENDEKLELIGDLYDICIGANKNNKDQVLDRAEKMV